MEIRTKFNAGEDMFLVMQLGSQWQPHPCKILQIKIKIDPHSNYGDEDTLVKIFYVCFLERLIEIPEKECFTYKEAQKECDKRNKGVSR